MIAVRTIASNGTIEDKEVYLGPESGGRAKILLRRLPGATCIVVPIFEDQEERVRAHVDAEPDETVALDIVRDADGQLRLEAGARNLWYLPPVSGYEPTVLTITKGGIVDLVILVDATMRMISNEDVDEDRFLLRSEPWALLAGKLAEFPKALAGAHSLDVRVSVLAFGDHAIPGRKTDGFVVYPSAGDRRFTPFPVSDVAAQLKALRAVDGGDCIDALADGLAACRDLNWRERANKAVLLVGDSPGYSLNGCSEGLPSAADIHTRKNDVFEEARELHRRGIALFTLLNASSTEAMREQTVQGSLIAAYVQQQYRRLATLPEWYGTVEAWNPTVFAQTWLMAAAGPIGRGPCHGHWVDAG